MIAEINNLIPLLDKDKDALLIGLLQHRLYDEENKKAVTLTDRNIFDAKKGLKQSIESYIYNEVIKNDDKYKKAEKILERSCDCDTCNYSIVKEFEGRSGKIIKYNSSDETERCERCYSKQEILERFTPDSVPEHIQKSIDNILEMKEYEQLILCKATINQIRKKIKKLCNQ